MLHLSHLPFQDLTMPAYCSSTKFKVTVSTVVPRGVKCRTPELLRRTRFTPQVHVSFTLGYKDLSQLPPLKVLPRMLVPRHGTEVKPPVMHYGRAVDTPKLMQYAKERNVLYNPVHDNPWDGLSKEELGWEDDDDPEDDGSELFNRPPPPEVEEYGSMERLLRALNAPEILTVSLYTKYDFGDAISHDDVQPLREALDEKRHQYVQIPVNAPKFSISRIVRDQLSLPQFIFEPCFEIRMATGT
ncbi:hypothetical protein B0H21DRAFT_759886 [Amylocystis lapponica]|nr:hypothetical protein B0H21DRAFT_759886 [Amylocystis lapponica]